MTDVSQLAELGLFDARVPRYTSYPTAPQFSDQVAAPQQLTWLAALPHRARLSLYVHIPFCRRLCWFCACRTQGMQKLAPVVAYVETLKAELALIAGALPPDVMVSQVHWGGGTPTLLPPDQIRDLAGTIAATLPQTPDCEISVEIDPNEIDEARLDALAEMGMSRASIGVQDFDPHIQAIIGRVQSFEITAKVVDALRARGISSLNTDILYGLPDQTTARITDSVQKLLSLSPDRVALYGYAHVPWMARRQTLIPSDRLPTPEERLQLFETARRLFVWDGYDEIGIDHFAQRGDSMAVAARDGTLRRNFQGYTVDDGDALLGLGASAISRLPQGYMQNDASTGAYTRAIREGRLAGARGHAFGGEDPWRARMIEELMCTFRIDRAALKARYGMPEPWISHRFAEAERIFGRFVQVNDAGLSILPEGRPLTRMIARAFDAYAVHAAGHSSAI